MRIYQSTLDILRAMPPFIRPLRDANREGVKSQTRRVIKEQERLRLLRDGTVEYLNQWGSWQEWVLNAKTFRCPYGRVESVLYMREPLFKGPFDYAHYVDDKTVVFDILTGEPVKWIWKVDTLSQLYMPKIAARSFFQYEFIRVERLQEISDNDAIAEGVRLTTTGFFEAKLPEDNPADHVRTNSAAYTYSVLWDAINMKRGFGWHINPWVWVLGYKPFDMKEISVINSNMVKEEKEVNTVCSLGYDMKAG